jgi:hypothetical protein
MHVTSAAGGKFRLVAPSRARQTGVAFFIELPRGARPKFPVI